MTTLASLRASIQRTTHRDEHLCVEELLTENDLPPDQPQKTLDLARELVLACREDHQGRGSLDTFLQEFGLSNKEGVALMCLAEALLRVPDEATAENLITEKIQSGDWASHLGHSDSLFINASVWGLMLTGEVLSLGPEITGNITDTADSWLKQLVHRLGEPVATRAILQAMRILGNQYVMGGNIDEAIRRGRKEAPNGDPFSFDMLGEGARTYADARRYFKSYTHAIDVIGKTIHQGGNGSDIYLANGISIKLSALHPRYEYAQKAGVMTELLPRIRTLALAAKQYNMGLSIDAEEAHRLDLSLDIFQALAQDPDLSGWHGLGFVLQAYQKRAPLIAQWLIALAEDTNHRLMVRLVKGAYWDAEIKHAQEQGFPDYPVFTRKVHTDLCYEHCARLLLAAPQAIYPQFATHNAHTLAMVLTTAGDASFEFQRLHGMGQRLYQHLREYLNQQGTQVPLIRTYAPVGQHRELLPYLVRRLLENGANSSFVNQVLDKHMPVDVLVQDVTSLVAAHTPYRHEKIPTPPKLYSAADDIRENSPGIDLNNPISAELLLDKMTIAMAKQYTAGPIIGGELIAGDPTEQQPINGRAKEHLTAHPILSPANSSDIVGHCTHARTEDIQRALSLASSAQPAWDICGGYARATILERMAKLLEQQRPSLMGLICKEAGRTIPDALSEVREAIDFCRYYALQARLHFSDATNLPGPTGEGNQLSLHGRGVFLCISPWNFPLAIFTGQIAAALVAGNTVIAKPAECTPLVAALAVQLFHQAGIPPDVLHLVPGKGAKLGKLLVQDQRISGVAFTGSTETAKLIHQELAKRPGSIIPLIAETGGQNIMVVDSTALPEQVVDDVIHSAFLSAGQRCSALRVLFLQEDVADDILNMLVGALDTYQVGDPTKLATDIGPVISQEAQKTLMEHIKKLTIEGLLLTHLNPHTAADSNTHPTLTTQTKEPPQGYFVTPHIFDIESLQQLPNEIFGPILHVIRYNANELDKVIKQINDSHYGLTLGVHSRIQSFADYIFNRTQVGNTYINRNMVGAVVGTNPFGGCGLSGTGPKAGGPHYLLGFSIEKVRTENITARGGNTELFRLTED
jgi:RHH-type transcriptional regulator, proline utilization regulon repressor / proline dehydrogenase / delta 1-pyrroline-5-carboxylate dehydrogenase